MSSSTATVSAGRFTYDGQNLTVDGYGRCDPATLRAHLKFVEANPLFTKTGQPRKRLPRPDQPTEFYVAQIIHYGLKEPPSTITRDHAKKMLEDHDRLTAFRVPKEVETLESKLAKKWADAHAKAKKQVQQQVAANIPVVVEDSKPAKRKRESNDAPSRVVSASVAVPSSSISPKKPRVETAVKSSAGPAAAGGSKSKAKPEATQAVVAPKVEKTEKKPAQPLDLDAIAGYYAILAPGITREWAPRVIKFALAPSPGRSHLWGDFDFGPVAGQLRSSSTLSPANRTVRFLWRGRDTGEGMQRFGKQYTFSITFQPDGAIKGTFAWLGKFEFTGTKNNNYPKPLHKVPGWKQEFWAVNPGSYEYESRARWGGWHDPGPAYVEPNSDTDDDYDAPGSSSGPRRKQTAKKSQPFY